MDRLIRLSSPAGRATLVAAILGSGIAFLDGTVVNVALPHIGEDLGATIAGLQWTVNAYTLALASFVLLGGALGDRYGRKRVFLIGVAWFAAASVLCGLANQVGVLIIARALQGLGAALLVPGSLAMLQGSLHPDDRGRAIGAWSGFSGISTILGPFLGGWLIDTLSWRWVFFLNLPLAAAVLLISVKVPETSAPNGHRFDLSGALLVAAGLAGLTYALIEAPDQGVGTAVITAIVVAVAGFAGFVLVERRRGEAAMLPPSLFANRQFSAINVVTLFVYAALSGAFLFLVVELQIVAGFSALAAGAATVPMTLLLLLGSERAGALGTRIGPRVPLTVGALVCVVGTLLGLRVGPGANYWTDVLPAVIVLGLGMTILVAPLTAGVLAAAPDRLSGVASGTSNAVARAAGLIAVAGLPLVVGLSGEEYAQPGPLNAAFRQALLWCAGLYLTGAVTAWLLVRPIPGRAVAQEPRAEEITREPGRPSRRAPVCPHPATPHPS